MDGYYPLTSGGDVVDVNTYDTVEACRVAARDAGAISITVRPDNNTLSPKTCVYYKTDWVPNTTEVVDKTLHYSECLDKTKTMAEGCK